MNLESLLTWIPTILGIGLTVGGLLAIKQGYSKRTSEIQESVINSLNVQNATQEKQIQVLEKEVARLKRVVSTIRIALKRRGLQIEIDNDSITLIDDQARRARTVQIRMTDTLPHKAVPKTAQNAVEEDSDQEEEEDHASSS